jgi:D-sedoheptulose 7-phosphate isomerase
VTADIRTDARAHLAEALEAGILAHRRTADGSLAELTAIADTLGRALRTGHKIFLFGNGGSAADAQHLAAELVGRMQRWRRALPAIALTTDTSILTALGNDLSFEDVYARQIEALGAAGDVAIGLSTSGSSENVVRGISTARSLGLETVGFTGAAGGRLREVAAQCFCAPATDTARIQEVHMTVGHAICQWIEDTIGDDRA